MYTPAEVFKVVAESIDQTIWMLDWPSLHPLYLSPAFDEMWGFPARDRGGEPLAWLDALVDEDRIDLLDRLDGLVRSGHFELEFRIRRPDGTIRWILVKGLGVMNEADEVEYIAGTATDVTELEETRAALAYRESMHDAWMRDATDFVVYRLRRSDDEPYAGTVEFVSPSIRHVMGVSPHAPLDEWFAGVLPDDLPRIAAAQRACVEDGADFDEIMRIEHQPSGELRWIRAISSIADDADGTRHANGLIIDVTDHMIAEAENQIKSDALAYSLNGYFIGDITGRVIYANQPFLDMWGYRDVSEIVNLVPEHYCASAETAAQVLQQLDEAGIDQREFTALRADGSTFEVMVAIRRFTGIDGQPLMMGTTIDITERKLAEAELERAATVFRCTGEGVVIADRNGDVVAVNEAFCTMSGYSMIEVVGHPMRSLWSAQRDSALMTQIEADLVHDGHWRGEAWGRRADGGELPAWVTISRVNDPATGEATSYVMLIADISRVKRSEAQLKQMAHHDSLTQLPNRLLLDARLQHAIERARREGSCVAVLFLDVDRFKNVNDSLGHPAGDELLREVAGRLRACVREEDTVARIGGDEFVVVLESIRDRHYATVAAEKVIRAMSGTIDLVPGSVALTASVGVVMYPDDGDDATTLLANADAAMYRAKEEGRDRYRFYTREMTAGVRQRLSLEVDMRRALDQGDQFVVHYQPLVQLDGGHIYGMEALVRWQHPERGLVSPGEFIPIAEECGLIEPLGEWVLREACRQLRVWQRDGYADLRVSVNVSGRQILRYSPKFSEILDSVLRETGLAPNAISLELTETVLMADPIAAGAALEELAGLGTRLSVDDFGTGYSSLSYLKRFPVSTLKIDRSFVLDAPTDASDAAICRAVIALAESLGLDVVAEGVETEQQRAFLMASGCANAQGYLFGKPMPPKEFAETLRRRYRAGSATPVASLMHEAAG